MKSLIKALTLVVLTIAAIICAVLGLIAIIMFSMWVLSNPVAAALLLALLIFIIGAGFARWFLWDGWFFDIMMRGGEFCTRKDVKKAAKRPSMKRSQRSTEEKE